MVLKKFWNFVSINGSYEVIIRDKYSIVKATRQNL